MSNSESRAKLASAAVAQVRKSLEFFTLSELAKNLKKAGCPYPSAVASELNNQGFIVKKGREYEFIGNDPIHFVKFVQCLDTASALQKSYSAKHFQKVSEIKTDGLTEEEMIQMLKSKGYRVLKPVTNFEEC